MNSKKEYLTYIEEKSFEINYYDLNSACPHIQFHFHNDYEIVFVKNGKGRISVDNCEHYYENGALVLLGLTPIEAYVKRILNICLSVYLE